ncbi:MAG TPA: hypothetical protein VMX16_02085 [Terriglobia bacterium]|nr:hypothetical protein [Terriglobia bacterium]
MAQFKITRPIELSGLLYIPKPGPDEVAGKTAKSAGNGRQILVNSEGVIELTGEEATRFTLGQLEMAAIPIALSSATVPQPVASVAPPVAQHKANLLNTREAVSPQPEIAHVADVKPVEAVPAKQPATVKPVAPAKPQAGSLSNRPENVAPAMRPGSLKPESKLDSVVSEAAKKPAEPAKPVIKTETPPVRQAEPTKPEPKAEPVVSEAAKKPVEPAKPVLKADPPPVRQVEPTKPEPKAEPVVSEAAKKPVEPAISTAKGEPAQHPEATKPALTPASEAKAGDRKPVEPHSPASAESSQKSDPKSSGPPKNG